MKNRKIMLAPVAIITALSLTCCGLFGAADAAEQSAAAETPVTEETESPAAQNTAGSAEARPAAAPEGEAAQKSSSKSAPGTAPQPAASAETEAAVEEYAYALPEEEIWESAADTYEMFYAAEAAYEEEPCWNPPMAPLPAPQWNTESYAYLEENRFLSTQSSPFSTFAADVDTASYTNARAKILSGDYLPPDAVRVEEWVNYFHYDLQGPDGDEPFGVTAKIAPCPWNEDSDLLFLGLQARDLDSFEETAANPRPDSHLVFLIDISGSMDEPDKLPLVQRAFQTLVENLSDRDRISMITYASGEHVILENVPGNQRYQVMTALESLVASGATNGESALRTAYELAKKYYIKGGTNRIIMATDGDFNVGMGSSDLIRYAQHEAKNGISISVLGFGMGNYKDDTLEAIADNGDGNYAYIDTIQEARKVLVNELGSTLFTIAKDVKLQVEFNPARIAGYRLIGYENRTMAAEDFADDSKDGGEIGAGHQVVALYEIIPQGSDADLPNVVSRYQTPRDYSSDAGDELLTLNIRCKEPEAEVSELYTYPVTDEARLEAPDDNLLLAGAAAQTAMLASESAYAGTSTYAGIRERLMASPSFASDDYRVEFLYLLRLLEER